MLRKFFKTLFEKPTLYLVIGPTGAGKTTYARQLAHEKQLARFSIDEWMVSLFGADRPEDADYLWYKTRIDRATEKIWQLATELLSLGMGSVLEIGLTKKADREQFYQLVETLGAALELHVVTAPVELRWERVRNRNTQRGTTFAMEVTRGMFDFVEDMWEPPDAKELHRRNGQEIATEFSC